jgi:hypothetical protein
MSLREVRKVLGDPEASIGDRPEAALAECVYLKSARLPEQLGVMFQRGRVARIDVSARGMATASGIAVGAGEDDVTRVYGSRIRVEPHKYDPAGHYLRFVPNDEADRPFNLIFETDGRQVTSLRTGTADAVSLVERCG